MNIGITGSIACGKSTVSSYLKDKGYTIIDADKLGHDVLIKEEIKKKILESFGEGILENNEINRAMLGKIVFSDKEKLELLNKIVHPEIRKQILNLQNKNSSEDFVFVDAALLLEEKFDDLVDKVIVVYIDEQLQKKRLMKRNLFSEEEALKRIKSQMRSKDKAKLGDYIIDNSNSLQETYKQIDELLEKLKKEVF